MIYFLHLHEIVEGLHFTLVCLSMCVCVCVSVSVCLSVCEQKADWTAALILTSSSLYSCLLQSLKPYWNWWPWVKGQGHSDVISIFPAQFSVNFPTLDFSPLMSDQMKFSVSLRYVGRFVFESLKIRLGDDVIVTSFKFSPNNYPFLKFYWTYKLRTWNQYTTT